jgi:hypothetical protein
MYSPQGYLLPAIRPSPDPRRPNMERRSPADFARGLAVSQKHLGYLEITNNLINGDSFLTRLITL